MTKEEIVKKLKEILDNSPEYQKELKKLEEEYYHYGYEDMKVEFKEIGELND